MRISNQFLIELLVVHTTELIDILLSLKYLFIL